MNLRDLKYLVALVEHRHFGKAAHACFVSQPALSMQIRKMEEQMGVQLLERTNKSVMLTEIGLSIAERAQIVLKQVDEMHEMAKIARDPFRGELKLGIFPTLAPYFLPHCVSHLTRAFPNLFLYLIEEQTGKLIKKLSQGKIDVAILALPLAHDEFVTTPLFEEEFMLGVSYHHPWSQRKVIKQTDLNEQSLLLLEEGHCLRDQALALCGRMNAGEICNFRATSLETLRHMVAAGIGITLMPKLACRKNDGVAYIPFSKPKPSRTIGLIWRPTSPKVVLLKEIAQMIKEVIGKKEILT